MGQLGKDSRLERQPSLDGWVEARLSKNAHKDVRFSWDELRTAELGWDGPVGRIGFPAVFSA